MNTLIECVACHAVISDGNSHYPTCPSAWSPGMPTPEPAGSPLRSRPDLLPPRALLDAGLALAGRTDRDADGPGYLKGDPSRYRAKLLRHVLEYLAGEITDRESGLPALAHVLANAAILHELDRLASASFAKEEGKRNV